MKEVKISEILHYLDEKKVKYLYKGQLNIKIDGFSSLDKYVGETITWVKSAEKWNECMKRAVDLCVVQKSIEISAKNQIITESSKEVFFDIIEHFFVDKCLQSSIGQYSTIGSDVKLGENVIIGNNCSIQGNIEIGDNTVIADGVVIKNKVKIGKNCHIQSLVVIGEDGFGYYEDINHKKTMIKHYGGVVIGDDVFIGSHTNIARGTIDDTEIGQGVKIAPSSHIGHNNEVGDDVTIICSQLYGSVHTGDNAYIVGSIIKNQSVIGKNSMVGMGSVVTKDVATNKIVVGSPAKEIKDRY